MAVLALGMTIFDLLRPGPRALLLSAVPRRSQVFPSFISQAVVRARRFYLGPSQDESTGLHVICGGWERSAPGYHIARSDFRYLAVEFVAGGHGTLLMGGREHALSRGTVFAYGPGISHEIQTDSSDRLSKYFVDFSGSEAVPALAEAGIPPGACQGVADPAEVQAALERVVEAGKRGTPIATRMTALQVRMLLLVLADVRLPAGTRGIQAQRTFLRCRDLIEKRHSGLRTAEEAAAACGLAPAYLSRLFRRFAGQPVYQFLMRLKMSEAAALLRRNALSVSETAEMFGMDPFHFSRAFKRVHGRAPVHFRTGRARAKR